VPAFGDPEARLLLVGLAPAAHGGNRTGRVFTGDESGHFLFAALHAVGVASRPESIRPGDGLELSGALVTAACRCAPPGNKPLPREFENCRSFLRREVALLAPGSAIVALGALAFGAIFVVLSEAGYAIPWPRPRFAHGCRLRIGPFAVFGSYHPSQQNTFTRRLTQSMLRSVLRRALAAAKPTSSRGA
jgi:uracil-DNA glycosylase family 4